MMHRCIFCVHYEDCPAAAEYVECSQFKEKVQYHPNKAVWIHRATTSICSKCEAEFDDVIFNAGSPIVYCPGCGRRIVEGD